MSTSSMTISGGLITALALCGVGCETSDLDERKDARTWATTGSALAIYAATYEPIASADGESPFADATCPVVADDGTRVVITGGCTDDKGKEWVGTATVVRGDDDTRALTLDDFGGFDPSLHSTLRGTVTVRPDGAGRHAFEASYTDWSGRPVA